MPYAYGKPASWALALASLCLSPQTIAAQASGAAQSADASTPIDGDPSAPAADAQRGEREGLARWLEDLRASEAKAEALANEPIDNEEIDNIESSWREQSERLRHDLRKMEGLVDKSGRTDILRDGVAVARTRQAQLARWLSKLQTELLRLDALTARARAIDAMWTPRLTQPKGKGTEGLEPMIQSLLARTKAVEHAALERKHTLTLLFRSLGDARDELLRGVDIAQASIASQRGQALFSLAGSPLGALRDLSLHGMREHALERLRLNGSVLRDYAREHTPVYVFQLLMFVLTVVVARRYLRHGGDAEVPAEYAPFVAAITAHPWASGILIVGATSTWMHDDEPALQRAIAMALSFAAAIRLSQRRSTALRVGGLLGLLAVDLGRSLAFGQGQPARLIIDAQLAVLLVLSLRLAPTSQEPTLRTRRYRTWLPKMINAARFLCILSIFLDFVGMGMLAQVIGQGTLRASYVVVSELFAYWTFLGVAVAATHGTVREHFHALRKRRITVLAQLVTVGQLILGAGWVIGALDEFGLGPTIWAFAGAIWNASIHFGEVHVSIGNVAQLGIVIWGSLLLSRCLRAVLEDDVMARAELPSGLPYAITTTTHYAVMLLGGWLALSAAGLDVTRFTVIAGALGVGIGFGMQTLVNNFICGLILLYERPIKVGDVIEVEGVAGEIRRIGMRSSTVLTWTGAEVLVPNASLITSKVTNYTLSDRMRRVDLATGIAYGTDPRRVLQLLSEVAGQNTKVLTKPAPQALFIGFGDSALNFELRVWIADYSDGLSLKSELAVAVIDALKDADIEIPFPQLDLHVRSSDSASPSTDSGGRERSPL